MSQTTKKPIAVFTEVDSIVTSYQVAVMLQMNPSSINKWSKEGLLSSYRTPGGHHRFRVDEVVHFLRRQKMPVPKPLALIAEILDETQAS